MYSQNNEEGIITARFDGLVGTFLDVGAYDGASLSNTRKLAELGWSGILVEGSSFSFHRLFDLYKNNEKMSLINCMVNKDNAIKSRIVKMWEAPDCSVSTIEEQNFIKWQKDVGMHSRNGESFSEMYVSIISPQELFETCKTLHQTIDFVSIDVEGGSVDIAKAFDPDQFWTSMVCVEHDGRDEEVTAHFAKSGFTVISKNQENIILGR